MKEDIIMPLPLILGGAAAAAAAAGVGSAIHGGVKMKKAHDTMKSAEQQHQNNIARFEAQNKQTTEAMDALGKKELEILESFQKFSDIFDRIQNRPEFQEYSKDDVKIPMYDAEKLKEVSVGAGVLLGGLGGAALAAFRMVYAGAQVGRGVKRCVHVSYHRFCHRQYRAAHRFG